jgi:hypothetical protein
MADKKISALSAASTPLAGTEVLPIVQSGSTVQVSVANLTLGRAVNSAGGTFTDNLIQGTAAKGLNFTANTPLAGMTSQLLKWYEEGTFTPVPSGLTVVGTPTYTGYYTRIGRMLYFSMKISSTTTTTSTADATTFSASGFPVIVNNGGAYGTCTAVNMGNTGSLGVGQIVYSGGTTTIFTPSWTAVANVLVNGFFIIA